MPAPRSRRSCWSSWRDVPSPGRLHKGQGAQKGQERCSPPTLGSGGGGGAALVPQVLTQPPSQHQGEGGFGLGAS